MKGTAPKNNREWVEQLKAAKAAGTARRPAPRKKQTDEGDDEPRLIPDAEMPWDAFIALNSQRRYQERRYPDPIPIEEIRAYAEIHSIGPHDTVALFGWILELDRIYLDHRNGQLAREDKLQADRDRRRGNRRR